MISLALCLIVGQLCLAHESPKCTQRIKTDNDTYWGVMLQYPFARGADALVFTLSGTGGWEAWIGGLVFQVEKRSQSFLAGDPFDIEESLEDDPDYTLVLLRSAFEEESKFWISWSDSLMEFGYGGVPGVDYVQQHQSSVGHGMRITGMDADVDIQIDNYNSDACFDFTDQMTMSALQLVQLPETFNSESECLVAKLQSLCSNKIAEINFINNGLFKAGTQMSGGSNQKSTMYTLEKRRSPQVTVEYSIDCSLEHFLYVCSKDFRLYDENGNLKMQQYFDIGPFDSVMAGHEDGIPMPFQITIKPYDAVPTKRLSCLSCVGRADHCNSTSESVDCNEGEVCSLKVKWKKKDTFLVTKNCLKESGCQNKILKRNTPGCEDGVVLHTCYYCCDENNCNYDKPEYWPELIKNPCSSNPCPEGEECQVNFKGFKLGKIDIDETTYNHTWYPAFYEKVKGSLSHKSATDTPSYTCKAL